MRAILLTAMAFLIGTSALFAQPGANPSQAAVDPKLDEVLERWEKAMASLESFKAYCTQTKVDKTFQATDVSEGTALFLKGQPSRASLELLNKKNPQKSEKYVCTGTFVYEYAAVEKVIRVHDMPQSKSGQLGEENFLQFLFGMKAIEAKSRYDIQYVPAPATDKWYQYLRIRPKLAQDKADFSDARLILMADSYLPRQIFYHQPNGNEITWDFPKIERNVKIEPRSFEPPSSLPTGWRMERVPRNNLNAAAPPPKYRPQDK